MIEFSYSDGQHFGKIGGTSKVGQEFMRKEKGGYCFQICDQVNHPNFDLMFLNQSSLLSCAGKKTVVTFSLIFGLELKQEPSVFDCKKSLKMPEKLLLNKKLSDIKIVCNEKIFECHKVVLSCQSDVFETMFDNNSRRFLAHLTSDISNMSTSHI